MTEKRDLRKMDKDDLIDEVLKLQVLLKRQMEAAPGTGPHVEVQGGVSYRTGDPFVEMRSGEAAWQMTPGAARRHALIVIDASVEAERDAAAFAFFTQEVNMEPESVAGFLGHMRDHRKDWVEEFRSVEPVTSVE